MAKYERVVKLGFGSIPLEERYDDVGEHVAFHVCFRPFCQHQAVVVFEAGFCHAPGRLRLERAVEVLHPFRCFFLAETVDNLVFVPAVDSHGFTSSALCQLRGRMDSKIFLVAVIKSV